MSNDYSPLIPGSKEYAQAKSARGEMLHFLSQNTGHTPRSTFHAMRRMDNSNEGRCVIRGLLRSTYHAPKKLYVPGEKA